MFITASMSAASTLSPPSAQAFRFSRSAKAFFTSGSIRSPVSPLDQSASSADVLFFLLVEPGPVVGALGVGSESVLERVAFPADNRVAHACDPVARAGPLPVVVAFNLAKLFGC